jgi:hypothetical protein
MSEADNVAPLEENVAPVVDAVVTPEVTKESAEAKEVSKFGDLLSGLQNEELKSAKEWEKFKDVDVETFLKSHLDTAKWTGKRGDIPQENATEDEWNEFYTKIGVPQDVSEYTSPLTDDIRAQIGEEEAAGYESYLGKALEAGHKHKIPKANLEAFMSEMLEYDVGLLGEKGKQTEAYKAEAQKVLTDEWGDNMDEMAHAVQTLEKHYNVSAEDMDEIESNPKTLILLGRIAKDLDEKGQVGNVFSQTRIGAQEELSDVEGQIRGILEANKGNTKDPRLTPLLQRRDRLQDNLG